MPGRTATQRLGAVYLATLLLTAQTPKPAGADNEAVAKDPIFAAMTAELERAKGLRLPNQAPPYYMEIAIDDARQFTTSASLGATLTSGKENLRVPRVQVRVGSPDFDNTDYMYSDAFGFASGRLPVEPDVILMRRQLWLSIDRAYKGAVEGLARKRSALRNVTQQEILPDFSAAPPNVYLEPVSTASLEDVEWTRRTRDISGVFKAFPQVLTSQVDYQASAGTAYLVNSEGTRLRYRDDLFYVNIRVNGQAADGMPVRDFASYANTSPAALPSEAELKKAAEEMARNVTELSKAPVGDDYTGPVLFEGVASAQLFAQLLGTQLGVPRAPVADPGRSANILRSELEGRRGSRILPEWMDAVDDPTRETYKGHQLFGHYKVDLEGVVPQPVKVIEDGKLANFLLTRTPVRGYPASNGRARLPGQFGAKAAIFSNLFIQAKETVSQAELKRKLLAIVDQRGLPYGLIVRKLDYPSAAPGDELRRLAEASSQRGGRIVGLPVMVYKVFPDGREELVRGLRFRGASSRSLRDIIAAGDDETVFDVLQNGTLLAQPGAGNFVTGSSVIAPSVLFEDLEFERRSDDWPRLPIVPPPSLSRN